MSRYVYDDDGNRSADRVPVPRLAGLEDDALEEADEEEPMKTIYVVQGSTGEYSDHSEWMVAAFTDEKMAQEMVARCEKFAPNPCDGRTWSERDTLKNPYDPDMLTDYGGSTLYAVIPVPLLDAIPSVES